MTALTATHFDALRRGLPAIAADTELVLRDDGDRPCALLRPTGAEPRNFVLADDGSVRELTLANDSKLAVASLFSTPSGLQEALAAELGPVSDPRLVAWRPGKRAVVSVRHGRETVFVKFLDRKTFERATAVFTSLVANSGPLHFARPTTLLRSLRAYAVAAVPGTSLRDHLARGIAPSWSLVDASVRALAASPCADGLPRHDFASARDAAVKMLQKGSAVMPELQDLAHHVSSLPAPEQSHEGFVHGDLHDKQLFLAERETFVIDLEGCGRGDANFDLVNLAEHLRLRALQQTGTDDGMAAAMLDRFAMPLPLRTAWQLCVRARLCGVYAMRPRWADLTRVLLSEVRALAL